MKVEADSALRTAALDLLRSEYQLGEERPGIHQSALSYCLTKTFWAQDEPIPPSDEEAILFSIGFGMERVLLRPAEDMPEAFEVDGITLSLDSLQAFDIPVDLKSTRMRAAGRKDAGGFQIPEGWKRQFMAYRYGLNRKWLEENVDHELSLIHI